MNENPDVWRYHELVKMYKEEFQIVGALLADAYVPNRVAEIELHRTRARLYKRQADDLYCDIAARRAPREKSRQMTLAI
jgi:hypothetical protein